METFYFLDFAALDDRPKSSFCLNWSDTSVPVCNRQGFSGIFNFKRFYKVIATQENRFSLFDFKQLFSSFGCLFRRGLCGVYPLSPVILVQIISNSEFILRVYFAYDFLLTTPYDF